MSFNKPAVLLAASAEREKGFTLIELLVAAAVALIIFGVLLSMLVNTGTVKARSALQLSVDESMRSSLELMSMDMRESVGPRLVLAGSSLPSGLSSFASTASSITVTRMAPANILRVDTPPGYPNSNSYTNSANTRIIQPNAAGRTCENIFSGGEYALVTNGVTSSWLKVQDNTPCISAANPAVLHPQTTVTYAYTPQTVLGRVDAIQYTVQEIDGVSALTRQVAGGDVQVVAPDITALQVEYSADGANFSTTPVQPVAVRLTLTGQRTQGTRTSALTLASTVFMRDLAVPAPVGGP